ncbi:PLP-dependent cysteine synthase family protein [Novosphingobium clariflavum]|uniref:PLP-dependent cysteine synthase family protein n=1 Tax=Novosphingobium clariflavum TaxID=2029884 RepID=A0ABV6S7V2_9SPHN|nr:pyridoxal-phosphate dependent enzyme [Novosphingobium clariflavum]
MAQDIGYAAEQDDTVREWQTRAIARLRAEQASAPETPLIELPLTDAPGIRLFLKDESAHASGSLKHRLARSLFLHALCNGRISPDTLIVEASSGSTAVSAAWFARLLGLPFLAVVPACTAREKILQIEALGGTCREVADPRTIQSEAARIARECTGYHLDQFTLAERATDYRASGNIAQAIFAQMADVPGGLPRWIVCGAGTGGTATTLGRHARYMGHAARLAVADPEASVFHRHYADRSVSRVEGALSCVEGIGRAAVELSFTPEVIDRMVVVHDGAGMAAAHHLSALMGRSCGPSTGVNLHACMEIVAEMVARGETGNLVTILCDSGERYRSTCHDPQWCEAKGFTPDDAHPALARFLPLMPDLARRAAA